MNEEQAIQLLKAGEMSGLEYFVTRYQIKAVRAAFLITRDPGLAEDIVQEAFIHAYRAIRSFDASQSFEPWFMRSVVNAAVKTLQRSERHDQLEQMAAEDVRGLPRRAQSVECQVENRELEDQVWTALGDLSPRERAVITERYFLEMTETEMAERSRTARGTIKWLLSTARTRLRELLVKGTTDE